MGPPSSRRWATPDRPVFEGYTSLAAWAAVTSQTGLGLLVGANTFRNPAVVANAMVKDHPGGSSGHALGLGGSVARA